MYARDEFGALTIALIVLLQQLASLLVQCRVRIWVNKQALDGNEDVSNAI